MSNEQSEKRVSSYVEPVVQWEVVAPEEMPEKERFVRPGLSEKEFRRYEPFALAVLKDKAIRVNVETCFGGRIGVATFIARFKDALRGWRLFGYESEIPRGFNIRRITCAPGDKYGEVLLKLLSVDVAPKEKKVRVVAEQAALREQEIDELESEFVNLTIVEDYKTAENALKEEVKARKYSGKELVVKVPTKVEQKPLWDYLMELVKMNFLADCVVITKE
jgi:hypothetical protein